MKKQAKKHQKLAFTALVILIPILVILSNAYMFGFSESFYHNEFKKVGTYDRVETADVIILNIFNYFNNKEDLEFFTEKEQEHLQDVKKVIIAFTIIFTIIQLAVATLIIYIRDLKTISKAFIYSLILLITVTLMLKLTDFTSLFNLFHKIFFQEGTWTFSKDDLLIKLFPFQFFYNLSKTIWINSIYQLAVSTAAIFTLKKAIRL